MFSIKQLVDDWIIALLTEDEPKKPPQRTSSSHVILFDACAQTLSTKKAEKVKSTVSDFFFGLARLEKLWLMLRPDHPPGIAAPKLGNRVEIYDDDYSRMLCTINLKKIGFINNTRRLFGKCNEILVVDSLQ